MEGVWYEPDSLAACPQGWGGGPWLHLLRKSYLSLPQTHPKPPKPDRNVKGFRINW